MNSNEAFNILASLLPLKPSQAVLALGGSADASFAVSELIAKGKLKLSIDNIISIREP